MICGCIGEVFQLVAVGVGLCRRCRRRVGSGVNGEKHGPQWLFDNEFAVAAFYTKYWYSEKCKT